MILKKQSIWSSWAGASLILLTSRLLKQVDCWNFLQVVIPFSLIHQEFICIFFEIQVFLFLVLRVLLHSYLGKYNLHCFRLYFLISHQIRFHYQINQRRYLICTGAILLSCVTMTKICTVPMLFWPIGCPVVNYMTS